LIFADASILLRYAIADDFRFSFFIDVAADAIFTPLMATLAPLSPFQLI